MIDLQTVLEKGDFLESEEGFGRSYYIELEHEDDYEEIGRVDACDFVEWLITESGYRLENFMWHEDNSDCMVYTLNLEAYLDAQTDEHKLEDLYNVIKWLKK